LCNENTFVAVSNHSNQNQRTDVYDRDASHKTQSFSTSFRVEIVFQGALLIFAKSTQPILAHNNTFVSPAAPPEPAFVSLFEDENKGRFVNGYVDTGVDKHKGVSYFSGNRRHPNKLSCLCVFRSTF